MAPHHQHEKDELGHVQCTPSDLSHQNIPSISLMGKIGRSTLDVAQLVFFVLVMGSHVLTFSIMMKNIPSISHAVHSNMAAFELSNSIRSIRRDCPDPKPAKAELTFLFSGILTILGVGTISTYTAYTIGQFQALWAARGYQARWFLRS
jgi:hypothetical protein